MFLLWFLIALFNDWFVWSAFISIASMIIIHGLYENFDMQLRQPGQTILKIAKGLCKSLIMCCVCCVALLLIGLVFAVLVIFSFKTIKGEISEIEEIRMRIENANSPENMEGAERNVSRSGGEFSEPETMIPKDNMTYFKGETDYEFSEDSSRKCGMTDNRTRPGDLFDFDPTVVPVIEKLSGSVLHRGHIELLEEDELHTHRLQIQNNRIKKETVPKNIGRLREREAKRAAEEERLAQAELDTLKNTTDFQYFYCTGAGAVTKLLEDKLQMQPIPTPNHKIKNETIQLKIDILQEQEGKRAAEEEQLAQAALDSLKNMTDIQRSFSYGGFCTGVGGNSSSEDLFVIPQMDTDLGIL